MNAQRLQLTWYNKDKALIPTETGKYGYTWVDPSDPRYCETHTLIMDNYVRGTQTPKTDEFTYSERADLEPQEDNLLILGESGDVLEALTRVPELAEKYVGKVKLIYIAPPLQHCPDLRLVRGQPRALNLADHDARPTHAYEEAPQQ